MFAAVSHGDALSLQGFSIAIYERVDAVLAEYRVGSRLDPRECESRRQGELRCIDELLARGSASSAHDGANGLTANASKSNGGDDRDAQGDSFRVDS